MEIKKIKTKDYPIMADLIVNEFLKYPYNDKWTKKEALNSIKTDLEKGEGFVAVENRKIVGFIILTKEKIGRNYIFIENLVVDANSQKKGIGRKLVRRVEDKYKDSVISLSVNKKSGAYKFYKRLGFLENKYNVNMSKKIGNMRSGSF